ncbi:hypothetical protein Bbelb_295630 [Branchiostoma belcheri]|nr:hypothetical protein Bbelb_295630 [Branchiostoma belcheri]
MEVWPPQSSLTRAVSGKLPFRGLTLLANHSSLFTEFYDPYPRKACRRLITDYGVPTSPETCYKTLVRPACEYAAPAWYAGLRTAQRARIETLQRRACRITLGPAYTSYRGRAASWTCLHSMTGDVTYA